ncbi:MAG: hypothetical protein DCC49_12445 [Acidobacteria bacterium]|nr:MAG: hypothetical protein DCC49_12445 [Acidobacteriota bacterium]
MTSFEYVVCDSVGQCAYGIALITVDFGIRFTAQDDLTTTIENTQIEIHVLANDSPGTYGPDLTTLTITRYPDLGWAEVQPAGRIRFAPRPRLLGSDGFRYSICDEYGYCTQAQVTVMVLDDATPSPVAVADLATTDERVSVAIDVASNDLAGALPIDPGSIAIEFMPPHGSAALGAQGEITYTPQPDFIGEDVITYSICEVGGMQCAIGTVHVTVEDAVDPVAVTDTVAAVEHVPVTIKVMDNDIAGDYPLVRDSVAVSIFPSHGDVDWIVPGEITYTANLGYAGADQFEYIVCDSIGLCAYAAVLVTVEGAADPVAVTDTVAAVEHDPLTIKVLENDIAGDYPLVSDSVAVTVFPSHGAVDWIVPGEITYTPSPGFVGSDQFEYIVCDSIGQCAYAPVFVMITAAGGPTILIGHVTNGGNARVSVFSATSGAQIATVFMADGHFSIEVPVAVCPAGFKIYFTAPSGLMPSWYKGGQNFSDANCTDAPAVLDTVTLLPAVQLTGAVKDLATNANLDGSIVYAFAASDGRFVGWSRVGTAGPGRYSISVLPGTAYKLKVQPPVGYLPEWSGGAHSFVTAGEVAPPSDIDFFVRSTGSVSGGVKRTDGTPIPGAQVYAWDATAGSFAGSAATGGGSGGDFAINLDPTKSYKVKIVGPSGLEDRWYPSAPGWAEAIGVAPPLSLEMELRDAVQITGVAAMPSQPTLVSAYTSCGCTSPTNTVSDIFGNYSLKVVSTELSGDYYRVRAIDSAGATIWFNGSAGFAGSATVSAPASGIDLTS